MYAMYVCLYIVHSFMGAKRTGDLFFVLESEQKGPPPPHPWLNRETFMKEEEEKKKETLSIIKSSI